MYYLYILYSIRLDSYYVGYTSNLQERLRKHNRRHRGFTGRADDWAIVYTEGFNNKLEAAARERTIKSWKSRKLLVSLIRSAGSEHPD